MEVPFRKDNFLGPIIDSPTKADELLNLLVTNANSYSETSRLDAAWAAVITHWWSWQS